MLNKDNYYSETGHMSNSQYKQFHVCETLAMAEINGDYARPETTALLVGSYIDAYVEGDLDSFIEDHPQIISSRGPTKGKPKAEYRQADQLIERFERDPFFMSFLEGKKQEILTGEIASIPFKIRIDILADDKIVDFKTVRDFEDMWLDGEKVSFIKYWGYDIQGAIYQEIVRQNINKTLPFYLACITKEDEPDLKVIQISDGILKNELKNIEYYAVKFQAVKNGLIEPTRCEKCDYCKKTKILKEVEIYD